MLNRKLLLVSSGADAPSTIGVAGGQGFGVGVYKTFVVKTLDFSQGMKQRLKFNRK